mgnify:CR=1 FL=1
MKTTQLFRLISIINSLFIIPACSAQNPSQSLIEDIFEDLSVNNDTDNSVNSCYLPWFIRHKSLFYKGWKISQRARQRQ